MTRKEFLAQVGMGAAIVFVPACITGLSSCNKKKKSTSPQGPSNIDFTVTVASGPLATSGNYLISNGVIVARTISNTYIAIAASCTHEGANVTYASSANNFVCPSHGAKFDASGAVINGPATQPLKQYNTALTGTNLRVYS